jgi:hypothetical protein
MSPITLDTLTVYLFTIGDVSLVEATVTLRGLIPKSYHPEVWHTVVDELSDMMEETFGIGRKPLTSIIFNIVDKHTRF